MNATSTILSLGTFTLGSFFLMTGQPLYFAATMVGCMLTGFVIAVEIGSRIKK